VLESNTRIVEWEDGSMSLVIGSEVFDAIPHDIGGGNIHYLFVRHLNMPTVEFEVSFGAVLLVC
jgi:hypothetical protein